MIFHKKYINNFTNSENFNSFIPGKNFTIIMINLNTLYPSTDTVKTEKQCYILTLNNLGFINMHYIN